MRDLASKDLFTMCEILDKVGIDQLSGIFNDEEISKTIAGWKGKDKSQLYQIVGSKLVYKIAVLLIRNLPKCEKELYAFLADLTGRSVADLQKTSMVEFTDIVMELVHKQEIKDFFTHLSASVKSAK